MSNRYLSLSPNITGWPDAPENEIQIPIKVDSLGRHKMLAVFDFDGTTFSTIGNWYKAVQSTALYFDGRVDLSRLPAMASLETGYTPLFASRDAFGIPTCVPDQDMWDAVESFLLKEEERNPSKMFPGAKKSIGMFSSMRLQPIQPIILTSNRTHDIQAMIAREMNGLEVDVVRVASLDKAPVLNFLAEHHHTSWVNYHRAYCPQIPMRFFGDSVQDVQSGAACPRGRVETIAVYRSPRDRRGLKGRFSWSKHTKRMRELGACSVINHGHMPDPRFY